MKKRMLLVVVSTCLILVLGFVVSHSSSEEVLNPPKLAPETHKLVFENRFVRVIESRVPAGGKEPKHSHPHGLTVYLANFESEVKAFPDGKSSKVSRQFGTAIWSEAIVHEVKNIGKVDGQALRIELKL